MLKRYYIIPVVIFFLLPLKPILAQNVYGSYNAFISEHDLYNSKEVRLKTVWQIIAQDRANFHVFKTRDHFDQYDDFFLTKKSRREIKNLIKKSNISKSIASSILKGGVKIKVDIIGNNSAAESINISLVSLQDVNRKVESLNFGIFGQSNLAMKTISNTINKLGNCDNIQYSQDYPNPSEISLYIICEDYDNGEVFESGAIIRFSLKSKFLTLIDIQFSG